MCWGVIGSREVSGGLVLGSCNLAVTSRSERFLFLRCPNVISLECSASVLDVLPKMGQLSLIIDFRGCAPGVYVVILYRFWSCSCVVTLGNGWSSTSLEARLARIRDSSIMVEG